MICTLVQKRFLLFDVYSYLLFNATYGEYYCRNSVTRGQFLVESKYWGNNCAEYKYACYRFYEIEVRAGKRLRKNQCKPTPSQNK